MSFDQNVCLKSRTLYLGAVVSPEASERLLQGLWTLSQQSKDVTLIINSDGGSSDDGLSIHEALITAPFKTRGIVMGRCLSAAFTVLQGCTLRLATPHSVLMFHDGTAALNRNHMIETVVAAKAVEKDVANYHKMIARRTGYTQTQIQKWCLFAKYMSAPEALELNFLDGIVPPTHAFKKVFTLPVHGARAGRKKAKFQRS